MLYVFVITRTTNSVQNKKIPFVISLRFHLRNPPVGVLKKRQIPSVAEIFRLQIFPIPRPLVVSHTDAAPLFPSFPVIGRQYVDPASCLLPPTTT